MKSIILNRRQYLTTSEERKRRLKIIGGGIAAILAITIALSLAGNHGTQKAGITPVKNDEASVSVDNTFETSVQEETSASVINTATETPELITGSTAENYLVTKVVDGDTIYVSGVDMRIRLIGVNTPETVSPSKPVECFGPEASSYLTNLLLGQYVGLELDTATGDTDIYGRPLRYVYHNGENINQKIILEGYGKEASYGSNYKYQSEFIAAEKYASTHDIGLWSPATCNGAE